MDYETERLEAFDNAEAKALLDSVKDQYIVGTVQRDTPADKGQKFMQDLGYMPSPESQFETRNTIMGGIRDAAQGLLNAGSDVLTVAGEDFLKQSGIGYAGGGDMQLNVPAPQLPEFQEPKEFYAQLARDFVQFGSGMVMAPGGIITKSAFSDAYFDPAEGGMIKPLINMGVLPEFMDFLAVDDLGEEAQAEDRLRGRLQLAGQGFITGAVIDGMIMTAKAIKNNPSALAAATKTIATALGASALIPTEAEAGGGMKTLISKLTSAENAAINKAATKTKTNAQGQKIEVLDRKLASEAKARALEIKNTYPESDGWLPISINPEGGAPAFKIKKSGLIDIKWKQPQYAFHIPGDGVNKAVHKQQLVDRTVQDINSVLARAKAGDQAAIDIIKQANWYRSMRTRLRQEFGGLGDVFADVIGATSAQTDVQQNYENALQVLRRFTRGEFDKEIALYEKKVAAGESLSAKDLIAQHKDPDNPFSTITKASGALFNTNSPSATAALLDMFRQIKAGGSPKTINFTGNLIGFGNEATIDVWAARYLRDAAGLPRIPPPAEKAVAGKHLTGSTLDNPKIGAEFGFGQEVFADAANQLNAQGGIKEFDPNLGDVGPDDLQAMIWFVEKEKWTNNGWTNKKGEGGSLDYESAFGGSPDRARVSELRSIIDSKNSTPEQIADAQRELETLRGDPQRFVAGVSRERPGARPTNMQQAELASELTAPLKDDETVIGFQANNTYGEFMGEAERALNYEVVTQTNFNPEKMTRALIEAGRKYDQDAVFISKVVPAGTANARPGVEVYFRNREGVDYAQQITAILRERGIDGFTFVTDARQMDRVSVQAAGDAETAAITGIRFQYIPEFDDAFDPANAAQIFADKADQFREIMNDIAEIDGITYADVVHYDTTVFKNTDRTGTEWINGGTSYSEYLGSPAGAGADQVRGPGNIRGETATPANSGG